MGNIGKWLTDAPAQFLGLPKPSDAAASAFGLSPAAQGTPYKEYNPEKVLGKEVNFKGIDVESLNKQARENANYQRDENIASANSFLNSQRGVNPALAAMISGKALTDENQKTAQGVNNQIAQNTFGASQFNSQGDLQAQLANQQNFMQTQSLNNQFGLGAFGANSGNYNAAMGYTNLGREAQADRAGNFLGGLIGGIGSLFSDETLKDAPRTPDTESDFTDEWHANFIADYRSPDTQSQLTRPKPHNVRDVGPMVIYSDEELKKQSGHGQQKNGGPQELDDYDRHITQFLDTLKPHRFSYKAGSVADDGGQSHTGIMAQDLERSQIGREIVTNSPYGKTIDAAELAAATAATMGTLHRRLLKLEGLKNGD